MQVRAKSPRPLEAYAYSAWSCLPVAVNFADGPVSTPDLRMDAALGGVGAVGGAWLHALWALPNMGGAVVLADSDPEGVSISNLNRCVLFGADDLGESKATAAARICANGLIDLRPFDQRLQDVDVRVPLVISAVDRNTARAAVQGLYPPRLLSGSTSGLRAEILRCDPDAGTACIRCYNPPERDRPDDELRRQFRDAPIDTQRRMADELGISLDEAVAWAVDGVCGYAADRLLAHLRGSVEGTRAFAVGFVSVSAGTLLAGQTVKELMGTTRPFEGVACRAHIVFLDPSDSRNGPTKLARDPECPMCDPATPAGRQWRSRYLARSYTT
jgi:molybdopterin/thiamine biosynthesis adenylyltransferase